MAVMMRRVFATLACGFSAACGGIVQTGEPGPSPTTGPDASVAASSPAGSAPTVDLPQCKLGFSSSAHPELACPFVVDGLCYGDKLSACGCACKGRSGSTCTSGFPALSGGNAVSVTCL